jgi:hypothetical protein
MKSTFNSRDPQFLREHIQSIINFYHPACLDKISVATLIITIWRTTSSRGPDAVSRTARSRFPLLQGLGSNWTTIESPNTRSCSVNSAVIRTIATHPDPDVIQWCQTQNGQTRTRWLRKADEGGSRVQLQRLGGLVFDALGVGSMISALVRLEFCSAVLFAESFQATANGKSPMCIIIVEALRRKCGLQNY